MMTVHTRSGAEAGHYTRLVQVVGSVFRRRSFMLALVLALGLLGYWLGPADLRLGAYTARVTATAGGVAVAADFPFAVAETAGTVVAVSGSGRPYRLIVEGNDAVAYQLGQRISYRAQVVDAAGQPVPLAAEAMTSVLTGPDYRQALPPTGTEGEWLLFTMRQPYKAKITSGLLFLVAALWLTELIPLAASALLIPIVIVVAGVTDENTIFQSYSHSIIMLFLAGFLLAEAMRRTGVDRLVALAILRRASPRPAFLMLTMMALTAFLSMWMSNTASVALVLPIALALLERVPADFGQTGLRRALVLGVAYSATIGGIGSAIGTPANIMALTFLNDFTGERLTFADWFAFGLPIVLVMVPLTWLYLLLAFRVRPQKVGRALKGEALGQELGPTGGLTREQWTVLLVFAAVILLWLTEQWHAVPTTIAALAAAVVLFYSGAIRQEDLGRISWSSLLTFGGGLAIGTVLVTSGVSDWLALKLVGLADQPPLVVVFLVASLTLVTGAFISNTACAAMLIPLAIPLAQLLGLDPRLLVAVFAIGSSLDFALVVGTPPTMMAYATGLFRAGDIFKRGFALDLLGLLVLCLGAVWLWRLMGVVTF